MRASVAVLAAIAVATGLNAGAEPRIPSDRQAIEHALNRLAFGPGRGDVAKLERIGLSRWIEQQLRPERIPTDNLDQKLSRLTTLNLEPGAIAREYIQPAREERRRRQQAAAASGSDQPPPRMAPNDTIRRAQQVFSDLAEAKILRAVYSDRQLEEVLTDFWFNHFNVFGRKGQTEVYLGAYERDVIRPHIFGKFRELLGATAKSPAMLLYLDNWQSGRNGKINENYARELLELHTLGVDGGYTQADIVAVAKALTGWTIRRPQDPGFRFAPLMHDRGEKVVLGHTIRAGGGIEDGERVLDIVAKHPSTARHIAFKLAQRFVSDTPPPALVDRAAARFRESGGDLREVVRVIVTSPEFFAPAAQRAKVKTPFEFVVSALRETNAEVTSAVTVMRALAQMGMPLYLCQPPTGYGDTADAWVSSGSLVSRINFALDLSNNRLRGVNIVTDANRNAIDIGAAEFQRQ
jgi:uncharacterized protein (DUF1800 family)